MEKRTASANFHFQTWVHHPDELDRRYWDWKWDDFYQMRKQRLRDEQRAKIRKKLNALKQELWPRKETTMTENETITVSTPELDVPEFLKRQPNGEVFVQTAEDKGEGDKPIVQ